MGVRTGSASPNVHTFLRGRIAGGSSACGLVDPIHAEAKPPDTTSSSGRFDPNLGMYRIRLSLRTMSGDTPAASFATSAGVSATFQIAGCAILPKKGLDPSSTEQPNNVAVCVFAVLSSVSSGPAIPLRNAVLLTLLANTPHAWFHVPSPRNPDEALDATSEVERVTA